MAVFENNPDEWQRLDWRILQNGWSCLYWQQSILDIDIDWFKKENYNIVDFDCSHWTDTNQIHSDLKKNLDFPDYYGGNLNALNDCLSELEINRTGLVIVFRHFHIVGKEMAHSLLDVFARNSRLHNLFGNRFLTLVQVDNPNYQIDPVGSCAVLWNGAEWMDSKRGIKTDFII
jgi:RNAse (barnase) inhibitor barstar